MRVIAALLVLAAAASAEASMVERLLTWVIGRKVEWYEEELLNPSAVHTRGAMNVSTSRFLDDTAHSRIDNLCYCSGKECETGYRPCTQGCEPFNWSPGNPEHCPYCCNQKAGSCGFSVACCRQGSDKKPILKCMLPPSRVDEFEVYIELDSGSFLHPNFALIFALLGSLTLFHVNGF
jgi:hypothetical protein